MKKRLTGRRTAREHSDSPIPGVHVLTAPDASRLELYDFEVLAMLISAVNWRRFCGPMHLCVDRDSHAFLKRLGVLGCYDDVELFGEEDFSGINRSYFWAAGKVLAAGRFAPPFVILDLDCFVHARPRYRLGAAVQPLNFEKPYGCYDACDSKYGAILDRFTDRDWDAPPVNVGMLGYYQNEFRDAYVDLASQVMREISARDISYPGLNHFRDHIIFVEQKLLPVLARHLAMELSIFEDGLFDQYLETPRVTHLWGRKGDYLRCQDEKVRFMERAFAACPEVRIAIEEETTASMVCSPRGSTRVFADPGAWARQGTKYWEGGSGYLTVARPPTLHCVPMPCGVTELDATINLETAETADVFIEYGPDLESLDRYRTEAVCARTLVNLKIPRGESDFEPGGWVHYRVHCRRAGDPVYVPLRPHRFRLARPYRDRGPWCCSVGAGSCGEENDTQHERFKRFHWPAAGRAGEDFHLAPGDLVNARQEAGTAVATWRSLRNAVEGLGREREKCGDFPVFSCIGAHEADNVQGKPPHARVRIERMPLGGLLDLPGQQASSAHPFWRQRYYYFTWGQVLFVALDSISTSIDGPLSPWQRRWAEDVLRACSRYKWKVLFTHRALDERGPCDGETIADYPETQRWLLDLLERYGVQLFLHGQFGGWRVKRGERGGCFVCASWGARVDAGQGDWRGECCFCRLRFGELWNESTREAHPDWLTIEVVDPARDTASGGAVVHRVNVHCDDGRSREAQGG